MLRFCVSEGNRNGVITEGRSLGRIGDAIGTGSGIAGGVAATKLTGCGREWSVLKAQEANPSKDLLTQTWPYDMRFRGFVKPGDPGKVPSKPMIPRSVIALMAVGIMWAGQPIQLDPQNRHYLLFDGQPVVLITSGEHYGSILNKAFQYTVYLETLAKDGLNLTRLFSGVYREQPGDFGIVKNTLSPLPKDYLAPWPRSEQWGAADGLNKFDLSRWDETFFTRLRDFMLKASAKKIIVEMNLFCPFYNDGMWSMSPLNARNNINGIGRMPRSDVYTLKDSRMLAVQERLVRHIVSELRDFDNVYFEICNEPYIGGVPEEWQAHIEQVISQTESSIVHPHLISRNIANGSQLVSDPSPLVSILNFHYSRPPDSVTMNYGLDRVIGINETGLDGTTDAPYRIVGWDFIVAGGALYNNLDYSFVAGHEDGTFTDKHAAGGGPTLRHQLRILREFIGAFNFVRMKPAPEVIKGATPAGTSVRALADRGRAYALYLHNGHTVPHPVVRGESLFVIDSLPRVTKITLDLPRQTTWPSGSTLKQAT